MTTSARWVYTPDQVRELDRIAIEEQGIPGYTLMTRAGQFAFETIRARYPDARHWVVLCGAGNNAGDGYVIARLALRVGIDVRVIALGEPNALAGDAAQACSDFRAAGGEIARWDAAGLPVGAEVIVDALLGTGLTRDVGGDYAAAVAAVNASRAAVIAVDIPSGLDGATGRVMGCAVRARLTVTFVGLKQGLWLGAAPDHTGEVVFDDLGTGSDNGPLLPPSLRCCTDADLHALLPPRARGAHKGDFGHVLVVGGNTGLGGAVRLAGEAALRGGAGLVTVATRAGNVPALLAGRPELMARGVEAADELDELIARADVIALGPGLGTDDWSRSVYAAARAGDRPLVIDADALNLLAAEPAPAEGCVLTPHPGEAGRLLGSDAGAVQADRLAALAAIADRYRATVVLKGHGTLIGAGAGVPWLVTAGNPGMATAGMGDVLTGLTAALLAQSPAADPTLVAAVAAHVHARAGDRAARAGQRGLIAGDLLGELRACLNR